MHGARALRLPQVDGAPVTAPRKPSAAERVVLLSILDGASPYDAEDMTRDEIARTLDECEAMGWIDDNHEATPAGRQAARR